MKLWTIQSEDAWRTLNDKGVLLADHNRIVEKSFHTAYSWMAEQMTYKLSKKPSNAVYPLWAWYMWEGKRKRRDMRGTGYAVPGERIVQLMIDVPDHLVLLSDFDSWHLVLNKNYYPVDEQDDNQFDSEYTAAGIEWKDLYSSQFHDKIVRSWQRIFSLEPNEYITPADSIQATFWELKREWVLKVEHFIARGKKYSLL